MNGFGNPTAEAGEVISAQGQAHLREHIHHLIGVLESARDTPTGPTNRSTPGSGRSSAVQAPDPIGLFVVPLNKLDIRYMITGAVAAVIYGEPRFTRDLDLILDLRPGDPARVPSPPFQQMRSTRL